MSLEFFAEERGGLAAAGVAGFLAADQDEIVVGTGPGSQLQFGGKWWLL